MPEPGAVKESGSDALPDKEALLESLDKVCKSELFSGSQRLQEFLKYVVQETAEGRGAQIFGKTIAEDVYSRPPSSSVDSSNLVRVDAGRLRRALEAYYSGDGAQDTIRFHIDPGQYAVRFEIRSQASRHFKAPLLIAAALILLLSAGVTGFFFLRGSEVMSRGAGNAGGGLTSAQRQVLMNESPAMLEAVDLATQARNLIFPASNPARLTATRGMFERAVELSPNYYGGHAGLAQIVGLQSYLQPLAEERERLVKQAVRHAQTARGLNPAASWTQSALAWTEFLRGNIGEARALSRRAVKIGSGDLNVLDFDSLIGIFSGDFDYVVRTANPANFEGRDLRGHVISVSYAVSRFHLGDFSATIAALNEAASLGAPTSPISFAYLIAAYQRSGQESEARRLSKDFMSSWPNSQLETILYRLFVHTSDADTLFDALRAAGWQSAQQPRGAAPKQ